MLQIKYSIATLLCLTTAAQGAEHAERHLKLVDPVITFAQPLIETGYKQAEAQAAILHGTIPDLYRELAAYGYRKFIANNPAIEQEAINLLFRFENSTDEIPEIRSAAQAWDEAMQDPTNIAAWLNELKLFSLALIQVANQSVDSSIVIHPQVKERILLNNDKLISPADRIKMGSFMLVTVARHSQRYEAMGHENYSKFADGSSNSAYSAVVASLPTPQD